MKLLLSLFLLLLSVYAFPQTINLLSSGTKTSLRGLSVVNNNVLWASGSNGTVARSTDGGKTFIWLTVAGYEQRDFRDVEAFDSNTAIIMAVAEPAIILKTKDGGQSWKKVFEDTTKGMFLDAMDFLGNTGFVIGDPIDNKLFKASTSNQGEDWKVDNVPEQNLVKGEAMFASSGTNNISFPSGTYAGFFYHLTITGGTQSRLLYSGISTQNYLLPIIQGKESQGANSFTVYNRKMVIVGGDFANDLDTNKNCVLVSFSIQNIDQHSFTFSHPQTSPHGYRSCVAFITSNQLITCGTSGVDISNDSGNNWTLISTESFHVCQKAKSGTAVFLAGKNGRIAKLNP